MPTLTRDHHHPGAGHAEDGHLEPLTDFDYQHIDRACFGVEPEDDCAEFTPEEIDAACKTFTALVEWMWQGGMKNVDGLQIRASVVCWIFLSQLRPLTLTEMAGGFGKKKQSLGRWVDDFKRKFPRIRIAHMKD
jgi:hypothetical protein